MTRFLDLRALACSLAVAGAIAAPAQDLPDSWTTGTFGYEVAYTSDNPYDCDNPNLLFDDLDFVPDDVALDMAQALDSGGSSTPGNPAGYHAGYVIQGFRAPFFDQFLPELVPDVVVYNCAPGSGEDPDCDNGSAPSDLIKMPSTRYCGSSELNIRRVIGHELFHHVQYAYIDFGDWPSWGRVSVEGTARMMEDQVYSDIDGTQGAQYHDEVENYLDNPNQDFWLASYRAALGWKYAAEQYGTQTGEPALGVDFVRRFWEIADANSDDPDVAGAFADAIGQTSGDSLFRWFEKFAIANVAREFDASSLPNPDQYRYQDENDGSGVTYANVDRSFTGSVPGTLVAGSQVVSRWGAAYLEVDVQPACFDRSVVGVSLEGDRTGYAVLAVDGQDRIQQLVRGTARDTAVSFVQRGGAQAYTRLVAALIGKNDFALKNFQFACGLGGLDVRLPDADYKAYVGPPEEPLDFIVRTTVTGPAELGDPTVLGLQPGDFEVYVGNNYVFADEAVVITGLYVQGEYWLVVRAPSKPNDATYDLHVNFGPSLTRTVPGAVSYEQRILDQVLTVDTSGSMASPAASPSIEAAINAASLFTDVAGPLDRLGLVTYAGDDNEPNDDAVLLEALDDATTGKRDAIKGKLASLTANGLTSIGDGIDKAANEFPANGSVLGEDWIVLLSDGVENESLFWNNVSGSLAGVKVNTIALGPDADQVLLSEIADVTGGQYYYVDTGTIVAGAARAAPSTTLPNRLADAFAAAGEVVRQHERLWEFEGSLAAPDTGVHEFTVGEGGIVDASFSINWSNGGDAVDVVVRRPDDSVVKVGDPGVTIRTAATHYVVQLDALAQGTWSVEVTPLAGSNAYIGILAGENRSGARLQLFFTQYMDDPIAQAVGAQYLKGLPQPIVALLTDRAGVVRGASVSAQVEHPDGTTLALPLFDDGEHGDGNADDGVYANLYTRTTAASEPDLPDAPGNGVRGSYNVTTLASGTDNLGQTYSRIRKGSFQAFDPQDPPSDTDGDRMPDRYENLHDCLDELDGNDDARDGDDDRLTNFEEWDLGTDPCNPDTDFGGESDYSEVLRNANPFDPADDALPKPTYVEVIDWTLDHLPWPEPDFLRPQTNTIRYPANPAYDRIRLLRATNAAGPFSQVADFDATAMQGIYRDQGLTNNQAYYYKIEPVDLNGNTGAPSHVFSGTPKSDPDAPIGSVLINNGDATTSTTNVVLWLNASDDVQDMMIANDASFAGASWVPFVLQPSWVLAPGSGGTASVFVRFRDAALNESETYHDAIVVAAPGSVGSIEGEVQLSTGAAASGSLVKVTSTAAVAPDYTDASGRFELPALAPGSYDLLLSRAGYLPQSVPGVVVTGGAVTDIGAFELVGIDTDGDGVIDIDDNCTLVANPVQRDSNGDGFGNLCDPDLNDDLIVNAIDLGLFKTVFFTADADADLNGDGTVNPIDLGILKGYFFQPPGPAGELP